MDENGVMLAVPSKCSVLGIMVSTEESGGLLLVDVGSHQTSLG